jgi:hypothetical protein
MRHLEINVPDDLTQLEKKIFKFAYANIYAVISDPIDKFIVAFKFDLGHSDELTAIALGMSRKTVWSRSKKIRNFLQGFKLSKDRFKET